MSTELDCRRCLIRLTPENARQYQGRWIGACRSCESILTTYRQQGHGPIRARGACRFCDRMYALTLSGHVFGHRTDGDRCPGSGDWPA